MNTKKCFWVTILILFLTFALCSCGFANLISLPEKTRMKNYYSDKTNYIEAEGTITDLEYAEGDELLILWFDENISPENTFTGRKFLIQGENLLKIKAAGFDERVEVGSFVEFVTVPAALYGYARPIVSLTVDDEILLEFEEGYLGLLNTL